VSDVTNEYAQVDAIRAVKDILEKYADDEEFSTKVIDAMWNLIETNPEIICKHFEFESWFHRCLEKLESGTFRERKAWLYLALHIMLRIDLRECNTEFMVHIIDFLEGTRGRLCLVALAQLHKLFWRERFENGMDGWSISLAEVFARCGGLDVILNMMNEDLDEQILHLLDILYEEHFQIECT
jgi:hypothetical protein